MPRPNAPQPSRADHPPAPAAAAARRPARRGSLASAAERRRATQELRALAHPLRLRLLQEFAGAPRTTMQVAAAIGEPPTRLYHHVNALERAGILTLARTRQVRGTTEKYFEVAKKKFGADKGTRLTRGMRGSLRGLARLVFDEAVRDLDAAIADKSARMPGASPLALRMLLNVSPAQLSTARKRLMATLAAIQKECKRTQPRADSMRWALTVALAPRSPRRR